MKFIRCEAEVKGARYPASGMRAAEGDACRLLPSRLSTG
jgi:hypothetical protein